ncbi:MAG: hypothetical protein GY832_26005 [Chloroflexi bacterium]|nr:hypothetical protein [Chloroflexota bacterium]
MASRRRITIELTEQDQKRLEFIQAATGEFTIIGTIRHALRETTRELRTDERVFAASMRAPSADAVSFPLAPCACGCGELGACLAQLDRVAKKNEALAF